MTNKPSWDDDTQKGFRQWHIEKYGVEPPIVNLPVKEESMTNKQVEPIKNPDKLKEPDGGTTALNVATRTRKGRWVNAGVTVTTYQEAIINVYIPARPKGMKKVTIEFTNAEGEGIPLFAIDWPEGKTELEAIEGYFTGRAIQDLRGRK